MPSRPTSSIAGNISQRCDDTIYANRSRYSAASRKDGTGTVAAILSLPMTTLTSSKSRKASWAPLLQEISRSSVSLQLSGIAVAVVELDDPEITSDIEGDSC